MKFRKTSVLLLLQSTECSIGLIKLYSPTVQPCTFPNNVSLAELLLTGNLSLTEQSMFSILRGIKWKYHRVHLTELIGQAGNSIHTFHISSFLSQTHI